MADENIFSGLKVVDPRELPSPGPAQLTILSDYGAGRHQSRTTPGSGDPHRQQPFNSRRSPRSKDNYGLAPGQSQQSAECRWT